MAVDIKKFGKRLKQLRAEKNISQREVAEEFNRLYGKTYDKSAFSRYELGIRLPNTETIFQLSDFYDVPLSYLLGLSDSILDGRNVYELIEAILYQVDSKDEGLIMVGLPLSEEVKRLIKDPLEDIKGILDDEIEKFEKENR